MALRRIFPCITSRTGPASTTWKIWRISQRFRNREPGWWSHRSNWKADPAAPRASSRFCRRPEAACGGSSGLRQLGHDPAMGGMPLRSPRGQQADLFHEAQPVEGAPLLTNLAIGDAPDGDTAHLNLFPGRREAHAGPGVGAAACPQDADQVAFGHLLLHRHHPIGKRLLPASRGLLILLQATIARLAVDYEVLSVNLACDFELALAEDLGENTPCNGLVSRQPAVIGIARYREQEGDGQGAQR